jgi:PAS domain S-box-containing protein
MKKLIEKIHNLSHQINSLQDHVEAGIHSDEFAKLKGALDEIRHDAEKIHEKQTGVLEPFESLINLLSEIVFEIDLHGKITFLNAYGIKKLELDKSVIEQGQLNMTDVIHPDDAEKVRASIVDNLNGIHVSGNEYKLITGSGENIMVQIFNSPVCKNDQITGLRGIAIDITQRKKMENELRESMERYRRIFNNSPLAIGYYTKEGILTDCNEKFARMLGNSQEVLKGFDIFRDLKNQGLLAALKESLISGSGLFEGVYKAVLSGKQAPTRVLFQGIRNDQGEICGGVALAEDISERVAAENALRASEEKFRSLVENIGEGAGITDINNRFLFSNRAANTFFGVEKEGLINRSLQDFISSQEIDRIVEETEKRKLGHRSTYELEIKRPDGQTRDLLVTATPNYDDAGSYKSTLGIFRDITDRKKIERALKDAHKTLLQKNRELQLAKEKAEESDKLKSAFLATMNHELRTPLISIIGLSELIDASMQSEEVDAFVQQINLSGMDLLELIDDIFQTIDLEMGVAVPELSAVNLAEFFSTILNNAEKRLATLGKTRLRISMDEASKKIDRPLVTDKSLLKKVFDNLIHNAIKFTNEGEVKFGGKLSGPNTFTFYVSDTGIGIPEEKHHLIFERFRQVDERLKREYGGTGLGLYYSKKIIELLKGEIRVKSVPAQGTTFLFTLPGNSEQRY